MNKLKGSKAVVTGAASGLGRAIALVLAGHGWDIGAVDLDEEGLQETLNLIRKNGGKGEAYIVDVSSAEGMETMAAYFFKKWGRVDLLVNNAGVAVAGLIGKITLEDWKWQLQNNLWSVINGCHSFIPRMKEQTDRSYIINIASGAGVVSFPEMSPYNVTKAGVISLSETLRAELAADNIGVTAVCPLFFETNLITTFRYTDKFQKELFEAAMYNARITSERVARLALRAAGRRNPYCFPQLSAKIFWFFKRLFPKSFYKLLGSIYSKEWGKPFFLWLARRGWL